MSQSETCPLPPPVPSLRRSETIGELVKAMNGASTAFGPALKTARNPHYNTTYVDLHSAWEAVRGPLAENGLALIQATMPGDWGLMLVTTLAHVSGEWVESVYPVRPTKDDPQGMGSGLTYARRYQLMTVLGLAPEDDDGQAASQPPRDDRGRDRERGQRRDDRQRTRDRRDSEAPRKPADREEAARARETAFKTAGPAPEPPEYFAQFIKHYNQARAEGDPNEYQLTRHLLKFAIKNEWASELHPNPSAAEVAAAVATVYRVGCKASELVEEARTYVRAMRKRAEAAAAEAAASPTATDGGNG